MDPAVHEIFNDIVLAGAFRSKGMKSFSEDLTLADANAIHDYLIDRANMIVAIEAQWNWWVAIKSWFFGVFASFLFWMSS
jgi:quinohemoprotein ethanol dehydrogenase